MISFTTVKAIANVSNKITSVIKILTPFRKGAETAATVSLPKHYIRQSAYLQDNQQNKKNAAKGLSFTAAVRIVALERILFDSWQFVCYKAFRALQ